jgi:phosphoribosylformimino-5-aminoimidazole carboxamide ribotide isomerase
VTVFFIEKGKVFYCSRERELGKAALRIIPVIDILNGVAVHAVRGRRKEYQPLKSVLCDCSDPLAAALAFRQSGFSELYVADLDAILGQGDNLKFLREIAEKTGSMLMVDAGVDTFEKARRLLQNRVAKIIIGTETLPNLHFVQDAIRCFGSEKIVVSLDLMNKRVLSKSENAKSMSAPALAAELQKMGVDELVVLDLARVGSGEGIDNVVLKEILKGLKVKALVGGGIRNIEDMKKLKKLGIDGVLLATALHSGKISVEELRNAGLL